MSDRIRCRRCASGVVDPQTQRCETCGRWWEPVALIPPPQSFSRDAVAAVLARPMAPSLPSRLARLAVAVRDRIIAWERYAYPSEGLSERDARVEIRRTAANLASAKDAMLATSITPDDAHAACRALVWSSRGVTPRRHDARTLDELTAAHPEAVEAARAALGGGRE